MSNYRNFIEDFPKRCGEILSDYKKQAYKNGREVTYMLAIASASITIPYARLTEKENPSLDKKKCENAVSNFDNLCGKPFLKSCLWAMPSKNWKSGLVKKEYVKLGADTWEKNALCLRNEITVKEVLSIIRNALAHGSIFTLPTENDKIENIIFLSVIRDKENHTTGDYDLIMVSPDDFNEFLANWIEFLKTLNIPSEVD
jgi:hypothetical protein